MLRDTKILEPRVGVEPTTCRLRIGCSTTELPRPLILKDLRLPVKQSENFALFLHCSLPEFRRFVASILIRERVALSEPLSPITSVGSGNSEPPIPEILSRFVSGGKLSSRLR